MSSWWVVLDVPLFLKCSYVPQVWLQLPVFNLNASLLWDKPAWGWLCWCTPCWAKHSPVKLPQRLAGQHLQNSLFSKIIFSVSSNKTENASNCLKQSLGFYWDSSTGHRLHEDMLARCLRMPWEGGSTVAEMKVLWPSALLDFLYG